MPAGDKPISGLPSYSSWDAADIIEVVKGAGNYKMPLQTILDNVPTGGGGGTGTPGGSNGNIQYNNSGDFGGATLSALLDTGIGNTQGDILYRGASGWSVLAPGAAGQTMKSGGASANPSWGNPRVPLFTIVTSGPLVATSPSISLFGSPFAVASGGSITIPANRLAVGSAIGWYFWGDFISDNSVTFTFTMTLGGTTVLTGVSGTVASAAAAKQWYMSGYLGVQSTTMLRGGANTIGEASSSTSAFTCYLTTSGSGGSSGPVTLDFTSVLALDLVVTGCNSTNKIRIDGGSMWIDG
jgi:hypothetical protein